MNARPRFYDSYRRGKRSLAQINNALHLFDCPDSIPPAALAVDAAEQSPASNLLAHARETFQLALAAVDLGNGSAANYSSNTELVIRNLSVSQWLMVANALGNGVTFNKLAALGENHLLLLEGNIGPDWRSEVDLPELLSQLHVLFDSLFCLVAVADSTRDYKLELSRQLQAMHESYKELTAAEKEHSSSEIPQEIDDAMLLAANNMGLSLPPQDLLRRHANKVLAEIYWGARSELHDYSFAEGASLPRVRVNSLIIQEQIPRDLTAAEIETLIYQYSTILAKVRLSCPGFTEEINRIQAIDRKVFSELHELVRAGTLVQALLNEQDPLKEAVDNQSLGADRANTPFAKASDAKGGSDASRTPKQSGGAPQKWWALYAVIKEADSEEKKVAGKDILKRYHQRHGNAIGQGKMPRGNPATVTRVRREYPKYEQA